MKQPILKRGQIVFVNHIFQNYSNRLLKEPITAKHCYGIILSHYYESSSNKKSSIFVDDYFLYYYYFNFMTGKQEKIYYSNILNAF